MLWNLFATIGVLFVFSCAINYLARVVTNARIRASAKRGNEERFLLEMMEKAASQPLKRAVLTLSEAGLRYTAKAVPSRRWEIPTCFWSIKGRSMKKAGALISILKKSKGSDDDCQPELDLLEVLLRCVKNHPRSTIALACALAKLNCELGLMLSPET